MTYLDYYIASVGLTFVIMLIGSWFDTKPHNMTIQDIGNSCFFSFLPIANVVVACSIIWYCFNQYEDVVLFGKDK